MLIVLEINCGPPTATLWSNLIGIAKQHISITKTELEGTTPYPLVPPNFFGPPTMVAVVADF